METGAGLSGLAEFLRVIVIPVGMYASYSKWIQKEIDGANHYAKPILGVNPGGQERISTVVVAAAEEMAGKRWLGGIAEV